MRRLIAAALLCLVPAAAPAGEADVIEVEARKSGAGTWRFDVTVRHADTGWDHYADGWDVLAPDGTVLGTRVLTHPHGTEQPFTRSRSGIEISAGVQVVTVAARDSVTGFCGKTMDLEVPGRP